jgi:hypothetical protein
MPRRSCLAAIGYFAIVSSPAAAGPGEKVSYSRDVKPILAARCYACHGPDDKKRKAKLRLDVREEAVRKAIKPGDAAGSRLLGRVASHDPDEVMPPPASNKGPVTAREIDVLRHWVEQGAKFDQHWAYVKPVRPPLPAVKDPAWVLNPIDHFVSTIHQEHGLSPAPEADRVTLLRRLSFDLTGLPPAPEDAERFVADNAPDAYGRLVERLLASPHFGERMALYWLDLVRYADTGGYHSDNHRDVWPFRDWVIDAFNKNKPFDQFTVEQLAGDMLRGATREQKIASGYNRLLMTTEEGGSQAKEYLAKYAADRVRNVAGVWLAATMGCCECHNHKFDPYLSRDFYQLEAFFADVKEIAVGRQEQTLVPTPAQAKTLRKLDRRIEEARAALTAPVPGLKAAQAAWEMKARESLKQSAKDLPKEVAAALKVDAAKRTAAQNAHLAAHYRTIAPELAPQRARLARAEDEKKRFLQEVPETLVTVSVPPRPIRVLPRGNWLDDLGELVQPQTPSFLPVLSVQGRPANRLDLARWLVSRDNPLTARVFVNRLWKLLFGQGIVKSAEDFGTQGAYPTHPQLLDWLAVEFMDSGCDVKHLIRLIVNSRTYRQSSAASAALRERDPGNAWLARQGRFRLDAELVRDNALAVSGLLVRKVGGPSVKPYQPAGYWSYLNFPTREWVHDKGEGLYRRGLYTYWCRTFLNPSLLAFDASTREECVAERPRSSTPLQALVLLNDLVYVESARVFAEHALQQGGGTFTARLCWAYRRALTREPRPEETRMLQELYSRHRAEYAADPASAAKLTHTGDWPVPTDLDPAELAAWTSVCRVLLNLHEAVTRY